MHLPIGIGDTFFDVRYLSAPFARPLGIDSLRADRVLRSASFVKSGPGGTVFPLSSAQTRRLIELIDRGNPGVLPKLRHGARVAKPSTRPAPLAADGTPLRAIRIQQPFAELILRGIKTIEVRSILTHIRGRVVLYASAGRDHRGEEANAERKHGIDVKKAQRGVIIGTVTLPPLRERREDIPLLVRHLVLERVRKRDATALDYVVKRADGRLEVNVDPRLIELFVRLPLEANVRELDELISRAIARSRGKRKILLTDAMRSALMPPKGSETVASEPPPPPPMTPVPPRVTVAGETWPPVEREHAPAAGSPELAKAIEQRIDSVRRGETKPIPAREALAKLRRRRTGRWSGLAALSTEGGDERGERARHAE